MTGDIERIRTTLSFVPAHEREIWLNMGMAIKSELGDAGFDLWDEWSSQDSTYNPRAAKAVWKSIKPGGGIGIGTLFFEAQQHGFKFDGTSQRHAPDPSELAERQRQQQEAEAARQNRADQAAKQSAIIWDKAQPCTIHAYSEKKQIAPQPGRMQFAHAAECKGWFWTTDDDGDLVELTGKLLLLPLYNISGELRGLQAIDERGRKSLIKGLSKQGLFIPLTGGKVPADYTGKIITSEGFATSGTIRQATGDPAVAAIDAGNLLHVAKAWREKCPHAEIIIGGDLDKSGAGQKKANEAALAVGGKVALPPFTDDELAVEHPPSDWNDYVALHDMEAVKQAMTSTVSPSAIDHHPSSSDAPEGNYLKAMELIRGCDITPEPVTWIWDGWLAAGKMHVLGGAPGTGKTTISMGLAATVTTGGRWPDGSQSLAGNVVIWSGEDDPADTLVPRLALSGADLNRVYFISDVREGKEQRSFDPSKDMDVLRRKLAEIGDVLLLIVDPIVSAVTGDSHKNAEVRRGLQPLVDLAAAMRCALLGITHFSKGTGGRDPVERLTGSLAFGALARVVLVAAKHQEEGDDGRTVRLLLRAKSNIGPDDGGFEYDLHQGELKTYPGVFTSSVLWGQSVEGAARELLASADATGDDGEGGTLTDAKRFLSDLLSDGPVPSKIVKADADGAGFSWATIRRAQKTLGIEAEKEGGRIGTSKQYWVWKLPEMQKVLKNPEDAQQKRVSTFCKNEHLLGNSPENPMIEVEI